MSGDAISWFEIPVRDLQRAQRFYEAMLDRKLKPETMGSERMAVFPAGEGRAQGCLNLSSQPVEPSTQGTRIYLDCSPSLDAALDRVQRAGGRITTPKVALPPAARDETLRLMVPLLPTSGVLARKLEPLVWISSTKVVPAGRSSVIDTDWASLGPVFVTVMV